MSDEDDEKLEADFGVLVNEEQSYSTPARFYRTSVEEPAWNEYIDHENYTTWREPDGVIGIRRGTETSVGATRTYSSKYDEVDWGD